MHHIGSDRINAIGMMKGHMSITKLSSNIVQYLNKKKKKTKEKKTDTNKQKYKVFFLVSRQYAENV